MTESRETTLLALLLALEELDVNLKVEEKEALRKTAQQLYLDPDDWNYIKEGLMVTIEGNLALSQNYQTTLVKLQAVNGNIPSELMPTEKELEVELPPKTKELVSRGDLGKEDEYSDEISIAYWTPKILDREDSDKIVKNLSFIKRLKDWISQK